MARFFSFCNIFVYAQEPFIFHLLIDFCISHKHIVTFFLFFLLKKEFDIFHRLSDSLSLLGLLYLADDFLDIFIYVKKKYKRINKKNDLLEDVKLL